MNRYIKTDKDLYLAQLNPSTLISGLVLFIFGGGRWIFHCMEGFVPTVHVGSRKDRHTLCQAPTGQSTFVLDFKPSSGGEECSQNNTDVQ